MAATPSGVCQVPLPMLPKVPMLKEGYLLKRQRGQRANADFRKLKFQQRYFCLTQDYLHYYVDQKVSQIDSPRLLPTVIFERH